jgi:hypothetical protein
VHRVVCLGNNVPNSPCAAGRKRRPVGAPSKAFSSGVVGLRPVVSDGAGSPLGASSLSLSAQGPTRPMGPCEMAHVKRAPRAGRMRRREGATVSTAATPLHRSAIGRRAERSPDLTASHWGVSLLRRQRGARCSSALSVQSLVGDLIDAERSGAGGVSQPEGEARHVGPLALVDAQLEDHAPRARGRGQVDLGAAGESGPVFAFGLRRR